MKKKLLTLAIAAAMVLSSAAAFAEETAAVDAPVAAQEQTVPTAVYANVVVTVSEITADGVAVGKTAEGGDAEFTYDEAVVMDKDGKAEIEAGDVCVVAVKANAPMTLQYPPRYAAEAVAVIDDTSSADIDAYTMGESGRYINAAGDLELNIADETKIVDVEGNDVEDRDLDGKDLIVFYSITTMSIPAQTPPELVVVLGETDASDEVVDIPSEEEDEALDFSTVTKITVGETTVDYTPVVINGKTMLPVRAIVEGVGLDVIWNDDQSINLGVAYNIKIGEDSYNKGKMTPISLGQAPVIIEMGEGGIAYAPLELFTDIMELNCTIADGTAVFSA